MKNYNGFILQQTENVKEVNGTATLYLHEKTGAQLLHIANADIEKSFSISFRTLPQNSTGVAHIIEHSVLAGSTKYPVKEPFVELMKGSLNSFLNAMTFPDKTMYPFASPNEKDYFNLMDVYLDAVFNPTIYSTKETFMQEGWHYEIDEEDKLIINGVVYSEMQGAMSAPSRVLYQLLQTSLFDNLYTYNSGGEPDVIPQLTQEDFVAFHSTYYHPSNSLICIYGDVDISKVLKFINANYLSKYDKLDKDFSIDIQQPIGNREIVEYYGIAESDEPEKKTFLAKSCVIETAHDRELALGVEILNKILLGTEASPLKNAMLAAGIGQNVRGIAETEILQPYFSVVAENADVSDKEKFLQVYYDTLTNLVKNGIEPKLVEACVSSTEFDLREGDGFGYPLGVIHAMYASNAWQFGDNPITNLKYENNIQNIKAKMKDRYFENLIEKYLLNSNHSSMVVLAPKKGINEAKEQALKDKLAKTKEALTPLQIEEIKESAAKLLKRQQTPDTPEALASMPRLSIADIEEKSEEIHLQEKEIEGVKVVNYDLFTSGIAYTDMYFDISGLSMEETQYAKLLSFIFDKTGTKKYSFEQLSNEINICSGGISADIVVNSNNKTRKCTPYFVVSTSAVLDKLDSAYQLANEMITQMDLSDNGRLFQLVQTAFAHSQMFVQNAGHAVALYRQRSYFMLEGKYHDATSGLGYFDFIKGLVSSFAEKGVEIAQKLATVYKKIVNKKALFIYYAGEEKGFATLSKDMSLLTKDMDCVKPQVSAVEFTPNNANQGIASQSMVQYVAQGYSYVEDGFAYSGKLIVLKNFLQSGYLWNSIRVQGGAYGIIPIFATYGYLQLVSYRDPHLNRTLSVYDGIGEFLRTVPLTQEELNMQIIAAIGEVDAPSLPKAKVKTAIGRYLVGVTNQDRAKQKAEILATTIQDVKKYADLFDCVMKKNSICVFGNAQKVSGAEDTFKEIITI